MFYVLLFSFVNESLAILYDHMIMYVGLFGHSVVVFHVFNVFFHVLCFAVVVIF